jgi:hypothetical protein
MSKYKDSILTWILFLLMFIGVFNDYLKDYDKSSSIYLFIIALVAINIRSLIIRQGKTT